MKNAILKWTPLLVLLVPMQSWAAPITYDIVFTATSGNAPTAAEFTYDADTTTLTGLAITWEGLTFVNFTIAGTADEVCGLGGAGAFALLMRACQAGAVYEWYGAGEGNGAGFELNAFRSPIGGQRLRTSMPALDFGFRRHEGLLWTISPRATSVPEPGSLALLGLGLAGLGFTRGRRKTTQV